MYVNTPWKYGVSQQNTFIAPELGNRYLKITDADLVDVDGNPYYKVQLLDLQCEAVLTQRYYIYATSKKTGEKYENPHTRDTLHELGKALAGPNAEFNPNPNDIQGGVVIGSVEQNDYVKKDGTNGVGYRVNHYFAAPQDWVVDFSEIADRQYYEGCEDLEIVEADPEEDSPDAEDGE